MDYLANKLTKPRRLNEIPIAQEGNDRRSNQKGAPTQFPRTDRAAQEAREKDPLIGIGYQSQEINARVEAAKTGPFRPNRDALLVSEIKDVIKQKREELLSFIDENEDNKQSLWKILCYNKKEFKDKLQNIESKLINRAADDMLSKPRWNPELAKQRAKETLFIAVDLIESLGDRLYYADHFRDGAEATARPLKADGTTDWDAVYASHLDSKWRFSQERMEKICNDFIQNKEDERLFVFIGKVQIEMTIPIPSIRTALTKDHPPGILEGRRIKSICPFALNPARKEDPWTLLNHQNNKATRATSTQIL